MILDDISKYTHFSTQEKEIAKLIVSQPHIIIQCNAEQLGKKSYTSKSTVIRFCQKLHFKGYHDFKLKFIQDLPMLEQSMTLLDEENLLASYPIEKTLPFTLGMSQYALQESCKNVNVQTLNRIINKIKNAKRIEFYGTGENYLILQAFAFRMQPFGFSIYVYNDIYDHNDMFTNIHQNTVAFIVSFTGANSAMIECTKKLKKKGIYTVALTANYQSDLEALCDETLNTYLSSFHQHLHLLTQNISLQYILDTIYTHFYIEQLKNNPDLKSRFSAT